MRQQPTNICPLTGHPCVGSRCAWWDHIAGACCIAAGADYIRDVADQLDTLNWTKKTARGATNTTDGKVEQTLTGPDSTSNDIRF